MNSISVLRVTEVDGVWAFDDAAKDLHREAFVAGADTLCAQLARQVGNTDAVTILFSKTKFPTAQIRLDWVGPEGGGNQYVWKETDHKLWLCPALLKYFDTPPKRIYVEARK